MDYLHHLSMTNQLVGRYQFNAVLWIGVTQSLSRSLYFKTCHTFILLSQCTTLARLSPRPSGNSAGRFSCLWGIFVLVGETDTKIISTSNQVARWASLWRWHLSMCRTKWHLPKSFIPPQNQGKNQVSSFLFAIFVFISFICKLLFSWLLIY